MDFVVICGVDCVLVRFGTSLSGVEFVCLYVGVAACTTFTSVPHVDVGADAPPRGSPLQNWVQLLTSVAVYTHQQRGYFSSGEAALKVLKAFERHGDKLFECETATNIKMSLSWVLMQHDKAPAAERILQDLLKDQLRISAKINIGTARTMKELAKALSLQGKVDEAENLSRKSIDMLWKNTRTRQFRNDYCHGSIRSVAE